MSHDAASCLQAIQPTETTFTTVCTVVGLAALIPLARYILSHLLFKPLSIKHVAPPPKGSDPSLLPLQRSKFRESCWKLTVYGVLSLAGASLIWQGGWVSDTSTLWKGWPEHDPSPGLLALYYFELSFYLASTFMLVWWEARRKDFPVMMAHHFVTGALIALSLRLK